MQESDLENLVCIEAIIKETSCNIPKGMQDLNIWSNPDEHKLERFLTVHMDIYFK